MKRRGFVTLLAGATLGYRLNVHAQQAEAIRRIGFLSSTSLASPIHAPAFEAFKEGLRELGYSEGRNLIIEGRWAEGQFERLPGLAAELVQLQVECIVTNWAAGLAAKNATATIPIVIVTMPDPVGEGLVTSLARPGGNITGLSFMLPEIAAKRLEVLKDTVPGVSQVAFLFNPVLQSGFGGIEALERAARGLKVVLHPIKIQAPSEFEPAFSTMAVQGIDAVAVIEDAVFTLNARRLAELAIKQRLPSVGFKEWPEHGGLLAYDSNIIPMYRRAANYVDKILKGAKPSDLPVEQPTKFDLVVNLKTAKALRLTVPRSILARADEVIE
jgi:putative ABC transport system substrate-binding protein